MFKTEKKRVALPEQALTYFSDPITNAKQLEIENDDNVKVFIKAGSYQSGKKITKIEEVKADKILQPKSLFNFSEKKMILAAVYSSEIDLTQTPKVFSGEEMPQYIDIRMGGEYRKIEAKIRLKYKVNDFSKIIKYSNNKTLKKSFLLDQKEEELRMFIIGCLEREIGKIEEEEYGLTKLQRNKQWQSDVRKALNKQRFILETGIVITYLNLTLSGSQTGLSPDDKTLNALKIRIRQRQDEIDETIHIVDIENIKNKGKVSRELERFKTKMLNAITDEKNFRMIVNVLSREGHNRLGGFMIDNRKSYDNMDFIRSLYKLLFLADSRNSDIWKELINGSPKFRQVFGNKE